jgi:hypothetical protein
MGFMAVKGRRGRGRRRSLKRMLRLCTGPWPGEGGKEGRGGVRVWRGDGGNGWARPCAACRLRAAQLGVARGMWVALAHRVRQPRHETKWLGPLRRPTCTGAVLDSSWLGVRPRRRWMAPHRICCSPLVTTDTAAMARPSGWTATSVTVLRGTGEAHVSSVSAREREGTRTDAAVAAAAGLGVTRDASCHARRC